MERVARAVEFVFLFTLAGGVLVLQAAIAATQDERKFDAAVLRTLGASQRQLRGAQIAEFLLLGAMAGLVASAGASITGWLLADRVFNIPFVANPLLWLYGVGGGAIAVTIAGWLGTRGRRFASRRSRSSASSVDVSLLIYTGPQWRKEVGVPVRL